MSLTCATASIALAAASSGTAFYIIDHACRHCGGRVLRAVQDGDQYRCASCKAVTMGGPAGICGCGLLPGNRAGMRRFHCGPNPDEGPKSPSEIALLFGDLPVAA